MSENAIEPHRRQKALNELRVQKMACSAHAYMRGSTEQFYDWIERGSISKRLPVGPPVWICGDCHTGNLGPVADLDGNIAIQIRDLDQTTVGNPAYDLVRLTVSLAMAARGADLPGVTTALMVEATIQAYTAGLAGRRTRTRIEEVTPLNKVMKCALKRKWRHLAEERIEDVTPQIPLGENFWPLTKEERKALTALFEDSKQRELMRTIAGAKKNDDVSLADAAYWVKGCSSLGRVRYAALVKIGKGHRLIDIKEATKALAPTLPRVKTPSNNAERVVMGAQHLSPFLGQRMAARSLGGHQVIVRELRPQDVKFDLSTLTQREAVQTAKLFANVLGKSHGHQMKRDIQARWTKDLKTFHSKTIDAPSWLWKAVVDLVGVHEASYLDHCRKFALSDTPDFLSAK